MIYGIEDTTDARYPETKVVKFSSRKAALAWVEQGGGFAWPGAARNDIPGPSQNFHHRLRVAYEMPGGWRPPTAKDQATWLSNYYSRGSTSYRRTKVDLVAHRVRSDGKVVRPCPRAIGSSWVVASLGGVMAGAVGGGYPHRVAMFDEGCMTGCYWHGGSVCRRCGARLTCCFCGQFVREDQLDAHACPQLLAAAEDEDEWHDTRECHNCPHVADDHPTRGCGIPGCTCVGWFDAEEAVDIMNSWL